MPEFIKVRFTGHAEVKPAYISLIGKNSEIISGDEFLEMDMEARKDFKVYRITHLPTHLVSSENFELED
jgi:hypothetical protein